MSNFYFLGLLLLFYMGAWFLISLKLKRSDIADIAWGIGFIFLAWSAFTIAGNVNSIKILVNILVTIWGLRLALHIYNRNKNKSEDYRYQEWRKNWGQKFVLRSFFQIFVLQGFLLYIIALPILVINLSHKNELGLLAIFGILVWLGGFAFESISDLQLSKFIGNPKNTGKLMQGGLWKYSRHPNYFGEIVLWWGIWLVAIADLKNFWTILGPLTITILIVKISGIPLLEEKMQKNPNFKNYQKTTSILIPWFNKQTNNA